MATYTKVVLYYLWQFLLRKGAQCTKILFINIPFRNSAKIGKSPKVRTKYTKFLKPSIWHRLGIDCSTRLTQNS